MPYQGSNPRYPVRGGARESSSTRYSPYGKSSTERRPLRGEASFYGGYEGGSNDLSTSTGRYNNNSSSGAADYRASHHSPSSTGRYPSSRGYYDRDTDAAGGHLDDRSYGNRYEDEDESEYSFSIRGRGRGRGGRGRGDGRGRGTIRGRGAHRGRGRGGYGHDFGGRSSDEFYGYTRAPPRHAEFGSYNDEGSSWAEEYTPAVQDTNMRSAEASYGSRNGKANNNKNIGYGLDFPLLRISGHIVCFARSVARCLGGVWF
ncbi:hypothetical protein GGF44_002851 [Coemansia sp. RSA 1694]|nr:hypothetical protein GGF44_002851 [Coemansia sp. RSA 1694]